MTPQSDPAAPRKPGFTTNVERSSIHEDRPAALQTIPMGLKVVVVLFMLSLIAMVIAIAVMKTPAS